MNKYKFSLRLSKLMGIKNWNKLQMKIKYMISFRKLYKSNEHTLPARCYVYIADGLTAHGGLSDRLRGIISLYQYCKTRNIPFRINFFSPFKLDLFLKPNNYDWELKANEFVRNKNVGFRFFNSFSFLNERKEDYFSLLDSNKQQVHCYTNVTIDEEKFSSYFNELFKPSILLKEKITKCLMDIGGGMYQ